MTHKIRENWKRRQAQQRKASLDSSARPQLPSVPESDTGAVKKSTIADIAPVHGATSEEKFKVPGDAVSLKSAPTWQHDSSSSSSSSSFSSSSSPRHKEQSSRSKNFTIPGIGLIHHPQDDHPKPKSKQPLPNALHPLPYQQHPRPQNPSDSQPNPKQYQYPQQQKPESEANSKARSYEIPDPPAIPPALPLPPVKHFSASRPKPREPTHHHGVAADLQDQMDRLEASAAAPQSSLSSLLMDKFYEMTGMSGGGRQRHPSGDKGAGAGAGLSDAELIGFPRRRHRSDSSTLTGQLTRGPRD
jgi:hypothetical protein